MNTNLPPFDNVKGAPGCRLRHRSSRRLKLFGRGEARSACLPNPAAGIPSAMSLIALHPESGREMDQARYGKGQTRKESGTAGQKVTIVVEDLAPNRAIGTTCRAY